MSTSPNGISSNPFALLGVSTRDDRHRIMEAAEEQSLLSDPASCQQARAALTNPRRRLDAEFAWFPGVAPSTATKAAAATSVKEVEQLPLSSLAKANALTSAALSQQPTGVAALAEFLAAVTTSVNEVQLDQVLREINEDREIAGFPAFTSTDTAEEALRERLQAWRRGAMEILNRAPTAEMAKAVLKLIEQWAANERFPRFLHDLLDDYAFRLQAFLRQELDGAERLVAKARDLAGTRPDALAPIIAAIGTLLKTWEELTYPIQMSTTLRGQTEAESERLAFMIRSLSVDLFNDYGLLNASREVSALVGSSFSALPNVAAKVGEDTEALKDLASQARAKEEELTYSADIGTFGKSRLAISPRGLEWKGQHYPLDQISGARWGAVRRSINGIPTGTDFLIAWNGGGRSAIVEFRNSAIFEAYIERLWRALAEQVLGAMIEHLRSGNELRFGNAVVKNGSVILRRRKLFGDEAAEFGWGDVTVSTADGAFVISGPVKSKSSSVMSYRDVDNVHFLEAMIRTAFKKGCLNLSETFI